MATRIMWVLMAVLIVVVGLMLLTTLSDSATPRGSSDRDRQVTAER
jgi:hypothetical protein